MAHTTAVRPGVPAGRVTGHASWADADSPRLGGCSRPHEPTDGGAAGR